MRAMRTGLSAVIAGLDPAIHDEVLGRTNAIGHTAGPLIMDARVKPGHDSEFVAMLV